MLIPTSLPALGAALPAAPQPGCPTGKGSRVLSPLYQRREAAQGQHVMQGHGDTAWHTARPCLAHCTYRDIVKILPFCGTSSLQPQAQAAAPGAGRAALSQHRHHAALGTSGSSSAHREAGMGWMCCPGQGAIRAELELPGCCWRRLLLKEMCSEGRSTTSTVRRGAGSSTSRICVGMGKGQAPQSKPKQNIKGQSTDWAGVTGWSSTARTRTARKDSRGHEPGKGGDKLTGLNGLGL